MTTSRLATSFIPRPRDEPREVREVFGILAREKGTGLSYKTRRNTPRTSRTSRFAPVACLRARPRAPRPHSPNPTRKEAMTNG